MSPSKYQQMLHRELDIKKAPPNLEADLNKEVKLLANIG